MCLQILTVHNICSKKQESRDFFSQALTFFVEFRLIFVEFRLIYHLPKEQPGPTLFSFQKMQRILRTFPVPSKPPRHEETSTQSRWFVQTLGLVQDKSNPDLDLRDCGCTALKAKGCLLKCQYLLIFTMKWQWKNPSFSVIPRTWHTRGLPAAWDGDKLWFVNVDLEKPTE